MEINHKKTFIGTVIAFFLSISCCWMSSLAIWLGGTTLLTSFAAYLGQLQLFIIAIAIFLGILSLVLYKKYRVSQIKN